MRDRLQDWWLSKDFIDRAAVMALTLAIVVAGYILAMIVAHNFGLAVDSEELAGVDVTTAVLLLIAVLGLIYYAIRHAIQSTRKKIAARRAKKVLEGEFLEAVADHVLTDEEAALLTQRAEALGLSQDQVRTLRTEHFQKTIQPILNTIRKTRRYSPQQEAELQRLAKGLQFTLNVDQQLMKYRMLWDIENTGDFHPVPIADPPIRLTRGEKCYLEMPATWNQMKVRRINRGYVGGSIGFRVAKGVTLRVGRAVPVISEVEELAHIATGMLYFTSKKIVFIGDKKSTNITLGRLANYELFRDGIQLNKTSGKPDVFRMDEEDLLLVDALLQVL